MSLFDYMHDGQKEIAARILDETTHTVIASCGRWYGKDTTIIPSALALLQRGKDILILGHIHDDNRKIFDLIRKIDAYEIFDYKQSPLTITNPAGGSIKFRSYNTAENIRGNNFNDVCFLNEAALLGDDEYMAILKPMFQGFSKVVITSTPRNTEWYRNIVAQGLVDGDRVWTKIASSFENPYLNHAEIERDRLAMPDAIFRQEYLAEFVDSSGAVFSEVDAAFTLDDYAQPSGVNFGGIDFGVTSDYSVLHILNAQGQTVYKDRFRENDLSKLRDRIMPKIKEFKARTAAESNGLGLFAVKELHNSAPSLINDFHQTNKTKEDIIGLLKIDMSGTPQVEFRKDDTNLKHECKKLEYKQLAGGKIRYEAASGHHDDEIVAVAMANYMRRLSHPRR